MKSLFMTLTANRMLIIKILNFLQVNGTVTADYFLIQRINFYFQMGWHPFSKSWACHWLPIIVGLIREAATGISIKSPAMRPSTPLFGAKSLDMFTMPALYAMSRTG